MTAIVEDTYAEAFRSIYVEFLVTARDRRGLFAAVSGTLSASNIDILSVDLFSRADDADRRRVFRELLKEIADHGDNDDPVELISHRMIKLLRGIKEERIERARLSALETADDAGDAEPGAGADDDPVGVFDPFAAERNRGDAACVAVIGIGRQLTVGQSRIEPFATRRLTGLVVNQQGRAGRQTVDAIDSTAYLPSMDGDFGSPFDRNRLECRARPLQIEKVGNEPRYTRPLGADLGLPGGIAVTEFVGDGSIDAGVDPCHGLRLGLRVGRCFGACLVDDIARKDFLENPVDQNAARSRPDSAYGHCQRFGAEAGRAECDERGRRPGEPGQQTKRGQRG